MSSQLRAVLGQPAKGFTGKGQTVAGGDTRRSGTISKTRHNDRRCIATGEALAPGDPAIRFVRAPDGRAVPDLAGKLPGRGAWVSAREDLVAKAAARGFAKAFKAETAIPGGPDAFAAAVGAQLETRMLNALGLARRAGHLVVGFEVVSKRAGDLCAYLSPQDASEDGVSRVARRVAAASGAPHIRVPTDAAVLAQAIGESAAVHLGVLPSGRAAAAAAGLWAGYQPTHTES